MVSLFGSAKVSLLTAAMVSLYGAAIVRASGGANNKYQLWKKFTTLMI
jgi:hypothetical protein